MIWGEGREKGERRERGTGTDERDWDRDIAKNVALLIWGGNGIELNSN